MLKITTLDLTIKGYFLQMNVTQKCLLIVWPSLVPQKSRGEPVVGACEAGSSFSTTPGWTAPLKSSVIGSAAY